MIKESYCSTKVYRLLKEKGFDGEIHTTFDKEGYTQASITHQMAMAWLRKKYGIFIAINNDDLDFNWQCYDLINRGSTLDPKILSESYGGFKHYEDAVEAALKFCLENLI